MRNSDEDFYSGERNIDKRMIALGVVGFLALATALFFLGFYKIGPKLRSAAQTRHEVVQKPAYTPLSRLNRETPPIDGEEEALDLQVTERGVDDTGSAGDQTKSSSTAEVQQDGNGLTVTLEPENREGTASQNSAAQTKPEPPKTTTENRRRKDVFKVQAGTFANMANAENLKADLNGRGYKAEIQTVQMEDRTLYRVQLGEYKSRDEAQKLANDLSSEGYSPLVFSDR